MKHKHAELIKQWADNTELEIQYLDHKRCWITLRGVAPLWDGKTEYRIKPVKDVRYISIYYEPNWFDENKGQEHNVKVTFVDGKLTDAEVLK